MEQSSRRRFLGTLAVGAVGLAGCTGGRRGGGDETTTTTGGESDPNALRLESVAVEGSPGGPIALDPRGSPLLLDFFATWCAPCKPQMEHLRTVDREFEDLQLRSVTREGDTDAIASFWRTYEGTWPVAIDPRLLAFEKYGVTRVPVLVVLDAAGEEVWRHAGLASADSIRTAVEEARA